MKLVYEESYHRPVEARRRAAAYLEGKPAVTVTAFHRGIDSDPRMPNVVRLEEDGEVKFKTWDNITQHELIRAAITLYDEAVAQAERKEAVA